MMTSAIIHIVKSPPLTLVNSAMFSASCMRLVQVLHKSHCVASSFSIHACGFFTTSD